MYNKINMVKAFLSELESDEIQLIIEDPSGDEESIHFNFFSAEDLDDQQIGYSVDDEGGSLTGSDEGDWKEEWIVIGYEEDLGDPLIVDMSKEKCPVFTAEHGAGEWVPIILFDSLSNMKKHLGLS